MKRVLGLGLSLFLAVAPLAGQTGSQDKQEKKQPAASMGKMSGMHDEMMKSMQADLDSMRANLQKMKDQLSSIKDDGAKGQAQLNIDMWQSLIDNMDKHMQMMKNMMGGGMMDHGSMHHKGMPEHGAGPSPTPKP